MTTKLQSYPAKFKIEPVKQVTVREHRAAGVSAQISAGQHNLYKWIKGSCRACVQMSFPQLSRTPT